MNTKEYLSPAQAAKLLHISPITIRYWANAGKLNFVTTTGGHRRFKLSDINQLKNTLHHKDIQNNKPTILVVEDNALHAQLVIDLLGSLTIDHKILIAENGFKAGTLIQSEKPDLILLDLMMPHLNGFSVCEHIRENSLTKAIPIIAMSGSSEPETIVKITQAGADAFLCKPFDIDKFNQTVKRFLSNNPQQI